MYIPCRTYTYTYKHSFKSHAPVTHDFKLTHSFNDNYPRLIMIRATKSVTSSLEMPY